MNIEKKVALLKKDLNEINEFEESKVSQVKLGIISLHKNGDVNLRSSLDEKSKEIEASLKSLKDLVKNRISLLEDELDVRRDFETEFEKCSSWIDQADSCGNIDPICLKIHSKIQPK